MSHDEEQHQLTLNIVVLKVCILVLSANVRTPVFEKCLGHTQGPSKPQTLSLYWWYFTKGVLDDH